MESIRAASTLASISRPRTKRLDAQIVLSVDQHLVDAPTREPRDYEWRLSQHSQVPNVTRWRIFLIPFKLPLFQIQEECLRV
jgi:hypothetical protein